MQVSASNPKPPRKKGLRSDAVSMSDDIVRLTALQITERVHAARAAGLKIAFVYLRISSDHRDERLGVTRQRKAAKREAKSLGVEIVWIAEDNDVSAGEVRTDRKSDWPLMMKMIAQHEPDYVMGLALDRIGRRVGDLEDLNDLQRKLKTVVWAIEKREDVYKSDDWIMLASFAAYELARMRRRLSYSQNARREDGKDVGGGMRPYGYADDRLTVIPHEKEIVCEIFRRIIARESGVKIARDLNKRNVPTVTGALWDSDRVRNIARKARYAGWRTDNHEIQTDKRAAWPAFVDDETWQAACRALEESSTRRGGRPAESLLGGILRCGLCGSVLRAGTAGGGRLTYRCSAANRDVRRIPGRHVQRQRQKVDEYVTERALAAIDGSEVEGELRTLSAEVDAKQTELVTVAAEIEALIHGFRLRKVTAADYFPTLDALRYQQREITTELDAAVAMLSDARDTRNAAARWEEWTVGKRRAWLNATYAAIILHPCNARGQATRFILPGEIEFIER